MLNLRTVSLILSLSSFNLFGWGQRGHALVTEIAVQLLDKEETKDLYQLLLKKSFMLAYLSNTPDTVWRSPVVSDHVRKTNGSTHYFDLEEFTPSMEVNVFNRKLLKSFTLSNQYERFKGNVGSAPHRILQFFNTIKQNLMQVSEDSTNANVDRALLNIGLSSHFIGDLANPMHLASDPDGYATGQGGLHAYFESHVVDAVDLGLVTRTLEIAKEKYGVNRTENFKSELAGYMWKNRSLFDSILKLDRDVSLLEPSRDDKGLKIPATRKPPRDVRDNYQDLIQDRIAEGAAFLAYSWKLAWTEANRPKFRGYFSYTFDHIPGFLEPTY